MVKGTALVTANGIFYRSKYYSCGEAIKNQWYLQAKERNWDIPILFFKQNRNIIFVFVDDQIWPAFELKKTILISEEEKRVYFRNICMYKRKLDERRRKRSRKRTVRLKTLKST